MMRNAEALEMAKQIAKDQQDWLHKAITRLLPPKFQDKIARGGVPTQKMMEWAKTNGLQVVLMRDSAMMEIHVKGKCVDRFVPQLLVDGRPVDVFKLTHPETFGDDIWADEG
jgi:hypothetical protein